MSGISLGQNISSLAIQRNLGNSSSRFASASERLSSGSRINQASDDAAGLAVSMNLSSAAKVYSQAQKNVTDGLSAFEIQQAALTEMENITSRQRELAEQAANGVYSLKQRSALNSEANALVNEFNRITETANFNGLNLLNSTSSQIRIQAGTGSEACVSFDGVSQLTRSAGSGSFEAVACYTGDMAGNGAMVGDINNDGKLDFINNGFNSNKINIYLGNGDGTFIQKTSISTAASIYADLADINGDSKLDIINCEFGPGLISVRLGNGDGTFLAPITSAVGAMPSALKVSDFDNDGIKDIAVISGPMGTLNILKGNGQGSFAICNTMALGSATSQIAIADVNSDGLQDLLVPKALAPMTNFLVYYGKGSAQFAAPITVVDSVMPVSFLVDDFNMDGKVEVLTKNNGVSTGSLFSINADGSFQRIQALSFSFNPSAVDINNDGRLDLVGRETTAGTTQQLRICYGNGDGSFQAETTVTLNSSFNNLSFADINSDGVKDIIASLYGTGMVPSTHQVLLAKVNKVSTSQFLNLNSAEGARSAINVIDATSERVRSQEGVAGANLSRLSITQSVLQSAQENFTSANSRITDADIAEESAQLLASQILQKTAQSVMAQANNMSQIVLKLLR